MKFETIMNIAKKRKIFLAILALVVCMLSANLSAATMHHMDGSDCMAQTSCNSCFISAVAYSSGSESSYSDSFPVSVASTFFQTTPIAPPSPPPKI